MVDTAGRASHVGRETLWPASEVSSPALASTAAMKNLWSLARRPWPRFPREFPFLRLPHCCALVLQHSILCGIRALARAISLPFRDLEGLVTWGCSSLRPWASG